MSGLRNDFLFSLRQIRRQPGFALVVILTLGSAMGISTALFSVADNSWAKWWPVPDPERMVSTMMHYSVEEAQSWARNAKSFSGLSVNQVGFTRQTRIEGRRVFFDFVGSNYFDVLGVPIALGRRFADDDERLAGVEPEAVISHRTWEEHFRRDPSIVGRRVALGNSMFTVAGVAAPGFEGTGVPLRRHLWFSLAARKIFHPKLATAPAPPLSPEVSVFGRLAPGVTPEQAQAELTSLSKRFRGERGLKAPIVAVWSAKTHAERQGTPQGEASLYSLLLAIAFLCMIACANVSNLMLARGHARRGEFAVRLSMGASRAQLVRQLLIEAFLLALSAGVLGIGVASAIPAHVFSSVPDIWEMMRINFALDGRVFLWTLLLSILACVIFGLAPALATTRVSAGQVLKDSNGQASPSLRTSLTSMQAFVSVMALGITGLVLRSDTYLHARDMGRRMEPLALLRPSLPDTYDDARIGLVKAALLDRLVALSDASNVAAASAEPRSALPGERSDLDVTPSYFDIMGLPVLSGRPFSSADPGDRTVVVNETLARALWPGESAIGKALEGTTTGQLPREVVGVVRDQSRGVSVAYRPVKADRMNVFLVRDPTRRLSPQATSIAASVDPTLQLEVTAGDLWLTQTSPGAVMTTQVFGEFGAYALALTAVGLFSLSEYLVRQRTREIGIRTALGAGPRHILSAILKPATRSLSSGLIAGTVAAFASGFMMRHWDLPGGVRPVDPVNYMIVALLLVVAGLLAMWRPAVKAMRIEPSEALRYE